MGLDYSMGKFNVVLNNTLFGPTAFQDLDNGFAYKDFADFTGQVTNVSRNVMEDIKQKFTPAVVTDLNIGYQFSKNISASVTVNNLFNILPTWSLVAQNADGQKVLDNATTKQLLEGFLEFSGRYKILGYNGSQFSQLGTTFYGQLTFKF